MERIYIALGKTGDILSVLPILYNDFKTNRKKAKLLTSPQFAPILSVFGYVEPILYAGSFEDLFGAIRSIKSNGNEAVPLQVFARNFPFEKKTPSFQLDQWLRGRAVEHFYDWPLVIDRRNANRERAIIKEVFGTRPFILFADYSESSPFIEKEALARSLKTAFGDTHDLIRLSSVRVQNFCDFVGLYNKASLLVTIETAHLHLSRASSTPVIALTTDLPNRWHGSAWHPRMAFQCRYKDYEMREPELLAAATRAISGGASIEFKTVRTAHDNGYNPSIVENGGIMTYRYHHNGDWKTRLGIEDGLGVYTIRFPAMYDVHSHEDARLFWFGGKLHVSFVMANSEFNEFKSVVGYGELVRDEQGWSVPKPIFPRYGNNNWGSLEKNWLFFEHEGNLFFLYSTSPEQVVVRVDGENLRGTFRAPEAVWPWGKIRGGCLVPKGDGIIRFFHSHTTEGNRAGWVYSIGAAMMEAVPPFKTIAVSQFPIISGNEKWSPFCRHWKANVAFPGGAVRQGNGWKLAFGANDCECKFAYLNEKDLNL